MKPVTTPAMPALSPEEIRIILAYRRMDARRRRENLALMEDDATEYPVCAAPALRLIAGGAA